MEFKVLSWSELKEHAKANPLEPFWGDYMRANTFNIVVGSPKAGKSSFVRELLSCALTGSDFLGQKVKHCEGVLYITEEEDTAMMEREMEFLIGEDVLEKRFRILPEIADDPIEFVTKLKEYLKQHPSVKVVILDTLNDYIPGVNVDVVAECKRALMRFVRVCKELRVTLIGLHHDNRHGKTLLDMVSGSRAFTGAADTVIGIHGSGNSKRSLESMGRADQKIPRTRLNFNPETRQFSLGNEVGNKQADDNGGIKGEAKRLLEFIRDNDGVTQAEMKDKLGYVQSNISKHLRNLGAKVKHDGAKPRRYYAAPGTGIEIAEEPVDLDAAAA